MKARTMQVASSPVAPVLLVGTVLVFQAIIGGSLLAGRDVIHPRLGTRVLERSGEYFEAAPGLWRAKDFCESAAGIGFVLVAVGFALEFVLRAYPRRTDVKPNRFYQA